MPVGIQTMTAEQEREWVERMRAGLGVFPSQAPKAKRVGSNPKPRSRRTELAEKYRRELHASLPMEVKKYLS